MAEPLGQERRLRARLAGPRVDGRRGQRSHDREHGHLLHRRVLLVLLRDEAAVLPILRVQVGAVEEEGRAVRLRCHHGVHLGATARCRRQLCRPVTVGVVVATNQFKIQKVSTEWCLVRSLAVVLSIKYVYMGVVYSCRRKRRVSAVA